MDVSEFQTITRAGWEILCRRFDGHTLAVQMPKAHPGVIFLLVGPSETQEQAVDWALEAAENGKFKPFSQL